MNNKTILYYILSGHDYYKLLDNRSYFPKIKKITNNEIEYFFNKRAYRNEIWYLKYLKILVAVFSVNLLSRYFERNLNKVCCFYGDKYHRFTLSTYFAIKTFNENRKFFNIKIHRDIYISELISIIFERIKNFIQNEVIANLNYSFIHGNTPIGIELEFSNIGAHAGKLFVPSKNDVLFNFSKYHHYHLEKFMWRFGAYIDANIPFQQYFKKGGFLEYTFIKPDTVFEASAPLTNSPSFAAHLIKEAVRFTPVKPHSLHITLESPRDSKRRPFIGLNDIIFMLLCSGEFREYQGKVVETRTMEKNMKDICVSRLRKNREGLVNTIEFSHMRLSRDFVKKDVYEPSILLFVAYKNLFEFDNILPYSLDIYKWGSAPKLKNIDLNRMLSLIEKGLEMEKSLPKNYKISIIEKIKELYLSNIKKIEGKNEKVKV